MQTARNGLPKRVHFRLILLLVNLDTSQNIMQELEKMIIPLVWYQYPYYTSSGVIQIPVCIIPRKSKSDRGR